MLIGLSVLFTAISYPFVVSQTEEIIKSVKEQTILYAPMGVIRQEVIIPSEETETDAVVETETEEDITESSVNVTTEEQANTSTTLVQAYTGQVLTPQAGRVSTLDGRGTESYYNLDMTGVVAIMRQQGYSEAEYPYWVRADGCKMLGGYVMCAANFSVYPRGSVVQLTLGQGLVCDTGSFATNDPYGFDVAVAW